MFSTIFPFRALNDAFKYKSSIMCTLPHVYVVYGGGGAGQKCVFVCAPIMALFFARVDHVVTLLRGLLIKKYIL